MSKMKLGFKTACHKALVPFVMGNQVHGFEFPDNQYKEKIIVVCSFCWFILFTVFKRWNKHFFLKEAPLFLLLKPEGSHPTGLSKIFQK